MRLDGDIPLRMRLGVLDHRGHHPFGDAPFGLQVEHALRPHPCGVPLGPFEVAFALDDHLQLVRPLQRFVQRRLLPFGRQTYPVEVTAERVRSGGLQKNLQPLLVQGFGQYAQRIEQRLAARNDDRLRRTCQRAVDDRPHVGRRIEFRVPRILGVAPAAPHVAPAQTDKIGGFPRMETFALNGIEILDEGQQASSVQQFGICGESHYSVTT